MKCRQGIVFSICLLSFLELTIIVLSWLLTAAWPAVPLRSLLTGSGIRWFFGSFVSFIASPPLVWILVGSFAASALHSSGLLREIVSWRHPRHSFAAVCTLVVFGLQTGILLLLVLPRHAVLLSITGTLFPGSFAAGIIPAVAFLLIVCSLVYGVLSFRFRTWGQLCDALCRPPRVLFPLLLVYVLACQLWATLAYVFGF